MILHTILGCPLFSCTSLRAPLKFPKFSVVNVQCSQKALKIRGFSTEKSEINYIQRADMSTHATHMQCMTH